MIVVHNLTNNFNWRGVERSRLETIVSEPGQIDWLANNTKIVHVTFTLMHYATETPSKRRQNSSERGCNRRARRVRSSVEADDSVWRQTGTAHNTFSQFLRKTNKQTKRAIETYQKYVTYLSSSSGNKTPKGKTFQGTCVACWCSSRPHEHYHQPVLSVWTSALPLGGASVFRFAQIYRMHYLCVTYDSCIRWGVSWRVT